MHQVLRNKKTIKNNLTTPAQVYKVRKSKMSKSSLTLKGLKDYAGESIAKLVRPVYNQLDSDNVESFFSTCKDITGHGAACGFSGFIYYSDTIAFYRKYKTEIKQLVCLLADELGTDPVRLVQGFNCIKDTFSYDEVARAMYAPFNDELTQIYNALSWFALEEVANAADNYMYENR